MNQLPILKKLHHFIRSQTMLRNSFYLMLANLMVSGVGFIYWIIVIKLYGATNSGLIQTLLAGINIVNLVSLLGLNNSIVKFLPNAKNPAELVNAMLGLITFVSLTFGIIIFWILGGINQQLFFVRDWQWLLFLCLFSGISAINAITDSIFIFYRKTYFIFIINTCMSLLRLALGVLLVPWGSIGILISIVTSIIFACIASVITLIYFIKLPLRLSLSFNKLQHMKSFAFASYFSGLVSSLPAHLIPIFITRIIGPEMTAMYYLPATVLTFLATIPQSTATSLYTEISHAPQKSMLYFKKSLWWMYVLLLGGVIAAEFILPLVLGFIGRGFAHESVIYLRWGGLALLVSGVSYLVNSLYYGGGHTKRVMVVSIIGAISVLVGSYIGLLQWGLAGLGMGLVMAQVIVMGINVGWVKRKLLTIKA